MMETVAHCPQRVITTPQTYSLERWLLERRTLRQNHIDWFGAEDVMPGSLGMPDLVMWDRVVFDGNYFDLDPEGAEAFLLDVWEYGRCVDVVAWRPGDGQIASWLGGAFALGQEQIFEPATYMLDGVLQVHKSPLDWLRRDRTGIVILRPDLAHAYLAHRPRLSFRDTDLGNRVRRWIQPAKPTVELLVEESEVAA
jgi:hypothetical protein